jgi:hypothetical protein
MYLFTLCPYPLILILLLSYSDQYLMLCRNTRQPLHWNSSYYSATVAVLVILNPVPSSCWEGNILIIIIIINREPYNGQRVVEGAEHQRGTEGRRGEHREVEGTED